MEQRALVTGIAGFAGSYLAEHLVSRGDVEVFGVVRPGTDCRNLERVRGQVRLLEGDLLEAGFVRSAVREVRPSLVFHLAGQASILASWRNARDTFENNIIGQLLLLEALAEHRRDARVLVVGSRDEYGIVLPGELPIVEDQSFRPNSPYAVSKIAQDMLGYQYFLTHGLPVIRVRPFNHIGPRQNDEFVASTFAKQIAEAELGLREPVIRVGNLEPRRDFTDVRDMVRAYWLALTQGVPGEAYNIGSGRAVSIAEMLDILVDGSRVRLQIVQEQARLRRADVAEIVCDATKFRRETGWEPVIPLETTLHDVLDYWRGSLAGGSLLPRRVALGDHPSHSKSERL